MSNGTSRTQITSHRSGWVSFAGFLMIVAGIFQAISGIVAILKPSLYVASSSNLLFFGYNTWGWLQLLWGIILMVSALSLFAGRLWGRVVAITIATISAILNFGFIWAYPLWSIMIIAIDIVVIYSVAMYGGEREIE